MKKLLLTGLLSLITMNPVYPDEIKIQNEYENYYKNINLNLNQIGRLPIDDSLNFIVEEVDIFNKEAIVKILISKRYPFPTEVKFEKILYGINNDYHSENPESAFTHVIEKNISILITGNDFTRMNLTIPFSNIKEIEHIYFKLKTNFLIDVTNEIDVNLKED